MERAIITAWTILAIVGVCVVALLLFPGLRLYVVAIFGALLAVVSYFVSNFFKEDLQSVELSRGGKVFNATALVIVLALCVWGTVYIFQREPTRSGNVYGLNLWKDAGFNRAEPIDTRQSPPVNPPKRPTFPCPDVPADECARIIFGGDITNDTDTPITAVSFIVTVSDREFGTIYHWNNHCYSNPVTINPGETQFIVFRIPVIPFKLMEEYGRENRAPTFTIVDTVNRRWNIINKDDESKQTVRTQSDTWVKLFYQCPDLYKDDSWPPPNLDLQALDKAFIDTVRSFGIPVTNEKDTFGWAHAVCTTLQDEKSTLTDAIDRARKDQPYLSANDAGHFVGAAAKAYCPDLLEKRPFS